MFKDYLFNVKCNDGDALMIQVVAESYEQAVLYAKSAYTAQRMTYADDRANVWQIYAL